MDNGTPHDPSDDYQAFSRDMEMIDLSYGLCEIMKPDEGEKLLRGLASFLRHNPAEAEKVFVSLGKVVDILKRTNLQSGSGGGTGPSMFDQLLPLLDRAWRQIVPIAEPAWALFLEVVVKSQPDAVCDLLLLS